MINDTLKSSGTCRLLMVPKVELKNKRALLVKYECRILAMLVLHVELVKFLLL